MGTEAQSVGNLSDKPVAELFLWARTTAFSGALVLAHDDVKKSVVFDSGKIISARSNIEAESLGSILLAQHKVTNTQLQKARSMIEGKEAVRQGEALVTMGLIDPAYLGEMLQQQMLSRVYELFRWKEGKYGFVPRIPDDTARINTDKSTAEICFRGLVECYKNTKEIDRVRLDLKPNLVGGHPISADELKLVGREMGLLRSITGVATVKEIIEKSRLDEKFARSMLLAFRDLGFIRLDPNDQMKDFASKIKTSEKKENKGSSSGEAVMLEIQNRLEDSKKQDLFALLGIDRKSTPNDAKAAYFALARKYHPDRLPSNLTADEKKDAEALFAKISEAHATLANPVSRKEYEASLDLSISGIDAGHVNKVLESELEYQKALVFRGRGILKERSNCLRMPCACTTRNPSISLALVGLCSGRDPNRRERNLLRRPFI